MALRFRWRQRRSSSPRGRPAPLERLDVARAGRRSTRRDAVVAVATAVAAAALPRPCSGALSISSGYETFLLHIRRHIVCEESDLYDEAEELARATPCDSMKDGPFCRGLPLVGSDAKRHRPASVDSIIPQQLFGDWRVTLEIDRISSPGAEATEAEIERGKQATETLNKFLQEHYKQRESATRSGDVLEGALDFRRLPLDGRLPATFSRGLPDDVLATWDGAWQVAPPLGRAAAAPQAAALRLNGAVGVLRFSRPVVVRRLLLRPPLHAEGGLQRLAVRGRRGGVEMWRTGYDFDPLVGPTHRPLCAPGDLVVGRWAGDGRKDLAVVLSWRPGDIATVRWMDEDPSFRAVPAWHLTTPDGVRCRGPQQVLQRRSLGPSSARPPPLWRDLARRLHAVDEVVFSVPEGEAGWLLAEVVVAAVREPSHDELEGEREPLKRSDLAHMVQVVQGPRALIVEASRAAVLYHADDMLEQGLQLRRSRHPDGDEDGAGAAEDAVAEAAESGEAGAEVGLFPERSSQGLQQFLEALAEGALRLPAHVSRGHVLAEVERLLVAMGVAAHEDSVYKRYGHFEVLFAHRWDLLTPIDALEVSYERWRLDQEPGREAQGVFRVGQPWFGSYFCTQGHTTVSLNVTKVDGDQLEADLAFTIGSVHESPVQGEYSVAGRLPRGSRVLTLEPVKGSWKRRPSNFVMVGLQGLVSHVLHDGRRRARFAGSVPTFGCDSFQLQTEEALPEDAMPFEGESGGLDPESLPPASEGDQAATLFAMRLSRLLERLRSRWRLGLQRVLNEKKQDNQTRSGPQVQLLARNVDISNLLDINNLLNIEISTNEGGEVVLQVGR